MRKFWGLGAALLLTITLGGCQTNNHATERQVTPTTSTVTTVRQVHTADFWGRWVSPTPATSLYLNANHRLALFSHHQTLQGRFTIKLVNDQATVQVGRHHSLKLTLTGANSMTLKQNQTSIKLTKDPNWHPRHSDLPTTASVALKESTLTPTFKLHY